MEIKLSLCIPTHNRARFIGETIESIISQADDSIEIIIVDGASTDNTTQIVQSYRNKFKNLVYYRGEKNMGVNQDMAKTIELAHGEYCWMFSDDDALMPGALKRISEEIKSGYEIYLCNVLACNLSMRPLRERLWLSSEVKDKVFNLQDKNELIEYCNKANSIGALFSYISSIILRREEWIKTGFDHEFDKTAYALASSLFSFIKRKCRLMYIKEPLVFWRNDNESFQNEGGLVKRFLLDFDGYLKLAEKYLSYDQAVKNAFLKVMTREHPWYTIIHVVSFIDSPEQWRQFKAKMFKFGYTQEMAETCYALGRYKNLVSFAVTIKRKLVKNHHISKITQILYTHKYNTNKTLMLTFFNYLLILNIFAGGFVLFSSPFEFYTSYIFIIAFFILYILYYRNISFNRDFLLILFILASTSIMNVYLGNNTLSLLTKQVLGILITGTAYYLLIKVNRFKIEKLFRIYLKIALIVACIGLFQEFSFLIGFKKGYDYRWLIQKWGFFPATGGMLRVNSIFMEPAHFAISMAPAFFVSLSNIFKKNHFCLISKWKNIIIILTYVLTFSSIGYIAILLSLILLFCHYIRKPKHLLFFLIIIFSLVYSAYYFSQEIRMRVDDSISIINRSKKVYKSHLSIYAIVSNTYIAYKSFIDNPLFGHGLGSHTVSYDKFVRTGLSGLFWQNGYPQVNKEDASSLFLRLISETGLFGITFFLYFIFKYRLKDCNDKNLQIANNAIFILFILQLLRQGHYFYNGFFFFVWIYYFTYKTYIKAN